MLQHSYNSGNFEVWSGHLGDLFIYVSRAPYSDLDGTRRWSCTAFYGMFEAVGYGENAYRAIIDANNRIARGVAMINGTAPIMSAEELTSLLLLEQSTTYTTHMRDEHLADKAEGF